MNLIAHCSALHQESVVSIVIVVSICIVGLAVESLIERVAKNRTEGTVE